MNKEEKDLLLEALHCTAEGKKCKGTECIYYKKCTEEEIDEFCRRNDVKREDFSDGFFYGCDYEKLAEDMENALESDKWHELAENKDDLPEEDQEVMVMTVGNVSKTNSQQRVGWIDHGYWNYSGGCLGKPGDGYVLRWKYLDT